MNAKAATMGTVGVLALVLCVGTALSVNARPNPATPDGVAQAKAGAVEQVPGAPILVQAPEQGAVRPSPATKRGLTAPRPAAGTRPPVAAADLDIRTPDTPIDPVEGGSRAAPDIYVDTNDGGCVNSPQGDPYSVVYCTIQDAITDAAAGDVIHVAAGTYAETVTIDKQLTLQGAGSANTIIDAGSENFGILITAGGVSAGQRLAIEDLSITDALTNGIRAEKAGGFNFHYVTIDGVDISGSGANGMELHNDTDVFDLEVLNCDFSGNGGIGLRTSSSTPLDSLLIDNSHFNGGTYGIYLTKETVNVTIRNSTMNGNSQRGYWGSNERVSNLLIEGCQANGNSQRGITVWSYDPINGIDGVDICHTSMDNNGDRGFHTGAATDGSETVATTIANLLMENCSLTGNGDTGFHVDLGLLSNVQIRHCDISGNVTYGVKHINLPISSGTVTAEDNWWGDASGPTHASNPSGTGDVSSDNVDFDPWLTTGQTELWAGGARLVETQYTDGGWGWPLNAPPTYANIIGPIGRGLARAYQETGDADMYAALQQAGAYLLTKTNNFSPSDGYLAAELDRILGGTTYVDHVVANYYDPLAAGTYDRNGLGTLYSTATYIDLIQTSRHGGGIGNLAAWDIGMGLVGAASAGVTGSELDEWVQGVKDEIDLLDGAGYYDVIGLAGGIYGLAFVGEDFDPSSGEHAAASDLRDLADILVSYQIVESGGFAWNSNYVIPYDFNETIQETSYSVLALLAMGGYNTEVIAAVVYINSVQLCTGGWENYVGNGENNEVTAEALWAVGLPVKNLNTGELFPTIQDAIDDPDTTAGDTIEIQSAVHYEGQVTVDKDLTLQGGSVDTIKMTVDTGDSGDSRGWFLVDPDVTLDVSDLIFDGNGHLVYQCFRHKGNGSFTNCTFHDIKYNESGPHYSGVAIAAFGGAGNPVHISDCVFDEIGRVGVLYFGSGVSGSAYDGNTYTGKSSGDWLDYALDISNGAVVTVSDSTMTECRGIASSDGSTSAGILVTTYYGPGTTATITGCKITSNTTGIAVGYDLTDTSTVTANNNEIHDNGLFTGIGTTSSVTVDAVDNWWGDTTGPDDAQNAGETDDIGGNPANCSNPVTDYNSGSGDVVSDTSTEVVDYCPWLLAPLNSLILEAEDCQDDTDGGAGYQIEVELWMRSLTQDVTGFQAFLEYDDSLMSYRGDLSSYTVSPFPLHIQAISTAEVAPGEIRLDGSLALGDTDGTSDDSLLATLVFDVDVECSTPTSIDFDLTQAFDSELSLDGVPLPTNLVNTDAISLDDTDPVIDTCPAPTTVECDGAGNTAALTAWLNSFAASDNCGAVTLSNDFSGLSDDCGETGTATVTFTATDDCGNESSCMSTFTIEDTTVPSIASCDPTQPSYDLDGSCEATVEFDATITDLCCVDSSGITPNITLLTGNATLTFNAGSDCVITQVDSQTVTVNCTALVSDVTGCPAQVEFTVDAVDCCGLSATQCSSTADVNDNTDPVITCPDDIEVNADAGGCDAVVTWADPVATDNCDGTPTVTCVPPSGSTFPTGTTQVTCTAEDDCGNTSDCTFDVTVNAVNDVDVEVELAGVMNDALPLTRCIHFVLDECGETVDVEMTFTDHDSNPATPVRAVATIEVPCGSWTQLCAKDEQHTLYDTTALTDAGTTYTANNLLSLDGGDTDNDSDVDINDVTYLVLVFGGLAADGGCPWDGTRDADFSNNGAVGSEDYTFQTTNWLTFTTCACTTPLVHSMKSFMFASDLPPQDRGKADLNGDGIVDHEDVKIFETQRGLGHELSTRMRQSMVSGDFNGDLSVDLADFAAFAQVFGRSTAGPNAVHKRFDLDGNGTIDLADFAAFAANFEG